MLADIAGVFDFPENTTMVTFDVTFNAKGHQQSHTTCKIHYDTETKQGNVLHPNKSYSSYIINRFVHEQELAAIGIILQELPTPMKLEITAYLKAMIQTAEKRHERAVKLAPTNIVTIFEAFCKITTLVEGRVGTSRYASVIEGCLAESFAAAVPQVTVATQWRVTVGTFSVLPRLTYEYAAVPGIYPVHNSCHKLGAIFRNSISHAQTVTVANVDGFAKLYPQVLHYVTLLENRRLFVNAEEDGTVHMVLCEKQAASRWFASKFTSIAHDLNADLTFSADEKSAL